MARTLQHALQLVVASQPENGGAELVDPDLRDFLSGQSDESFRSLAIKILPRLLRYFRVSGCNGYDAEELAQDVLCTIFRKASTIRDSQSFWPWTYKVARNALLQHVRRASRHGHSVDIDEVEKNQSCGDRGAGSGGDSFSSWMEWLEPGERQVMILRYVEDCDYVEIAVALGIPIGTVKSRLFQAKKKVSKQLSDSRGGRR